MFSHFLLHAPFCAYLECALSGEEPKTVSSCDVLCIVLTSWFWPTLILQTHEEIKGNSFHSELADFHQKIQVPGCLLYIMYIGRKVPECLIRKEWTPAQHTNIYSYKMNASRLKFWLVLSVCQIMCTWCCAKRRETEESKKWRWIFQPKWNW